MRFKTAFISPWEPVQTITTFSSGSLTASSILMIVSLGTLIMRVRRATSTLLIMEKPAKATLRPRLAASRKVDSMRLT